jgi:hypothetical protein
MVCFSRERALQSSFLSKMGESRARLFPTPSAGGPGKRAEFMLGEMKQGMDTITKIEDSAPMLSALG